MSQPRQLRQVRLEPNIVNEFKLNAEAWVMDISELFDEVVLKFLSAHKDNQITYLSQPKDLPVTNVRLSQNVFQLVNDRANKDRRSVPNLLYTAFIWYAKENHFSIDN